MNIDLTWQTTSIDSAATARLGEAIGARLHGGELIELVSDIGGGKTTLVQGIARGAGSSDHVASPSFTISRQYRANDKIIFHFDFYRLQDPGIILNELAENLDDNKAVTVIEWADIVNDVLPLPRLQIYITVLSENERKLTFAYPEILQYLIPTET